MSQTVQRPLTATGKASRVGYGRNIYSLVAANLFRNLENFAVYGS